MLLLSLSLPCMANPPLLFYTVTGKEVTGHDGRGIHHTDRHRTDGPCIPAVQQGADTGRKDRPAGKEEQFQRILDSLPEDDRALLKEMQAEEFRLSARGNEFYYREGIKDGFSLYRFVAGG